MYVVLHWSIVVINLYKLSLFFRNTTFYRFYFLLRLLLLHLCTQVLRPRCNGTAANPLRIPGRRTLQLGELVALRPNPLAVGRGSPIRALFTAFAFQFYLLFPLSYCYRVMLTLLPLLCCDICQLLSKTNMNSHEYVRYRCTGEHQSVVKFDLLELLANLCSR